MGNLVQKYQTKPLDCWAKFKEMRLAHFMEVATAKQQGKLLATGSIGAPVPLLYAFGDDIVFLGGETYAATVGAFPAVSLTYLAATEQHGYARDMCSYVRNYWGSMWSDRYMFTEGPFPRPDFCFTENMCDAGHGKWFQVVAEHFGVPLITIDYPAGPYDTRDDQKIELIVAQMSEAIEQIEKITGRKFDDEKFLDSARNYFEAEALWAEIVLLNRAVPATLDLKMMLALLPVCHLYRGKREPIDALRILRDEVSDRISKQIAASETEVIRVISDLPPPWHMLPLFRRLDERGVVIVCNWHSLVNGGDPDFREDGTVTRGKTPDERGWPMKTREDVLRAWGRRVLNLSFHRAISFDPPQRAQQLIALNRHYKSRGILLHYNRGCPFLSVFLPEIKMELEAAGIPVVAYEGNLADTRDCDANQILKRLNAFIEIVEKHN